MAQPRVLVVAGPDLVADPELLRGIILTESPTLGVAGRYATAANPVALGAILAEAGQDRRLAIVALPGPDPRARQLMAQPGPHAGRTVWCDLARAAPAEVAGGAAHLAGRGIAGLVWAIRHAVHRLRHPPDRIRYGADPDQWAELRIPAGSSAPAQGPVPVAVLVHGGYWRSIWGADLMDALAIDLAGRGFAAWNLEYRRPDQHGWEATTADVAAGLEALRPAAAGAGLDLDRVVLIGHSAGGQLALRAAADARAAGAGSAAADGGARVVLAVSLAGVLDLVEGDRRWLGTGAVAAALGGTPAELPEVYAAADPLSRLPLRVPQLVVQGSEDDLDLVDIGRRYVAAARAAGDEVVHLERPGGHFAVIDPATPIWRTTADHIRSRLPA
jgi:acetyl esterase/lipase